MNKKLKLKEKFIEGNKKKKIPKRKFSAFIQFANACCCCLLLLLILLLSLVCYFIEHIINIISIMLNFIENRAFPFLFLLNSLPSFTVCGFKTKTRQQHTKNPVPFIL